MIAGRVGWRKKLTAEMKDVSNPIVWFHCASLGEFEQGRPIIDSVKSLLPDYSILITFFSPSGYEIRKNYQNADLVHYLPWDTLSNARDFYQIVQPAAVVIIKYEFWYHLIAQGRLDNVPVISCSAIFRDHQVFFKPWGGLFRKMLHNLNHIFVQDSKSSKLLNSINIQSVTVSGDNRIDRVATITDETIANHVVESFLNGEKAFVVGSSWSQDISILAPFINREMGIKFIIAPHEVNEAHLNHLYEKLKRPMIRYTKYTEGATADILVVDTIGILSHIYKYGQYAYIGGAFGKGLHNILEPAAFGLPLFFGNQNYAQFSEAEALIKLGAAFAIGNNEELKQAYLQVSKDEQSYQTASTICSNYINQNTGATQIVIDHLKNILN